MEYNKIKIINSEYIAFCEDVQEKTIGPNLLGMLNYVYDDKPQDGWEIDRIEFLKIYQKKLMDDWATGRLTQLISEGKVKISPFIQK